MPLTRSRSSAHSKSPSSTSSSDSDDDEGRKTVASLRKRKRGSSKKGRAKNKKQKEEYGAYHRFAQWYLRSEHAFVDYCNVFTYGIRYEAKLYGKMGRDKFAQKYALDLETFFAMKDRITSFDDDLPKLKKHPEHLNDLGKLMNDAVMSARGNDIKGLLDKGLAYLALDLPAKELKPAIPPTSIKDQTRGHNHTVLSCLLTPVRLIEDFDKDPEEYHKKILRGAVKFNDEDFPSMLYPQPDGYDPEDLEANLLQNQTAVRFYKHLFTSPSSAIRELGTKPKKRTGQVKINSMKEVTPASIAYTFLMYWWNISAANDWRVDDDLTDRYEFYSMVLGLFEEHENDDEGTIQWRKDTLDWWNFAVFGIIPEKSDDESDNQPKATTLKLLREQRAQKAAAAAAAAAVATTTTTSSPSASTDPSGTSSAAASTDPSDSSNGPSTSSEATPASSTPSSAPTLESSEPLRSALPSSLSQSSFFLPSHIRHIATPPRSSPIPNLLRSVSRHPLTPAHRANIPNVLEEDSPVPRPVKYSHKSHH